MEESIELLKEAHAEIKSLRHQNQLMSARLEMYDSMMLLFKTRPDFPSMGMSPDVAWKIDSFLHFLNKPDPGMPGHNS